MPIERTIDATITNCSRYDWHVVDKQHLADLVARLTLGQYSHVLEVLRELNPAEWSMSPKDAAVEQLLKWLDGNVGNRDGWLFQMISWIILAKSEPNALLAAPHSQPAQKGFDGLCLLASEDGLQVHSIVYTEDKATNNPRDTVRDKVYPGIDEIINGSHESESLQKITTLLQQKHGSFEGLNLLIQTALSTADSIFRVAVTTSISDLPANTELFSGFESHVEGAKKKRLGETLIHENMREWMDDFAQLVKNCANDLKEAA